MSTMRTSRINTALAVVAALLLALSAYSYVDSVSKAERFARGQRFLPNLDPDEVAKITIEKGDASTRLARDGDRFVLPGQGGYPAKNEAVNRLLRDLLQIELEQEVGGGQKLADELGLGEGSEAATTIALSRPRDREMVRFRLADAPGDVGGSYLQRTDEDAGTIYRTTKRIHLQISADSYLDDELLQIEADEILAIRGRDFAFERATSEAADAETGETTGETTGEATGDLELLDLPAGKKASPKANQLKSLLRGLRFQKHHLADAPEVQGLRFDRELELLLKDGSGYVLQVASKGEDAHYLRIRATFERAPLSIAVDADEDEVRATSEKLTRADEVKDFNAFHGSWIYEVTEITAEKVRYTKEDLVEDA